MDLDNMYKRAVGRSEEGREMRGSNNTRAFDGKSPVGHLLPPPTLLSHLFHQSCIICMYSDRSFMHYKSKTQAPRLYCVYSGLLSVHKLHFLADAYLSSLEFAPPCARSKWARLFCSTATLNQAYFELLNLMDFKRYFIIFLNVGRNTRGCNKLPLTHDVGEQVHICMCFV